METSIKLLNQNQVLGVGVQGFGLWASHVRCKASSKLGFRVLGFRVVERCEDRNKVLSLSLRFRLTHAVLKPFSLGTRFEISSPLMVVVANASQL